MASSSVGRVYAEGLYRLGVKHRQAERLRDELAAITGLMRSNKRFRDFLMSPGIPAAEKKKALVAALSGKASPHFLHFLELLVDKRRQAALPEVEREYQRLLDAGAGVVRGEMVYAAADTNGSLPEMESLLGRRLGKTVKLERREDPALLGGVVVRVGDLVLDGSLDRKLKKLTEALKQRRGALEG